MSSALLAAAPGQAAAAPSRPPQARASGAMAARRPAAGAAPSPSPLRAVSASDEPRVLAAVAAVQRGRTERFGEIYRAYFGRVFAVCRSILRHDEDAQDATQETFIRALRALPGYEPQPGVPFRAWLLRIARNSALSRLERSRRGASLVPLDAAERLPAAPARGGHAWISDEALAAELDRMSLAQRQVLVLRFVVGLSPVEAGAVLGRTPAAVRQQQARALRRLREQLEPPSQGGGLSSEEGRR
jgi:RNA polymerase sigma-70 factor (ECF subfamily)